jgi:hypothetical protein
MKPYLQREEFEQHVIEDVLKFFNRQDKEIG